MNEKVIGMRMDRWLNFAKWSLSIGLLFSAIVMHYQFEQAMFSQRLIGWLMMALVILALLATTVEGKLFLAFARQSQIELKKVFWPTKQETSSTTLIVLVMVLVMGIILWLIDTLFLWIVGLLTG